MKGYIEDARTMWATEDKVLVTWVEVYKMNEPFRRNLAGLRTRTDLLAEASRVQGRQLSGIAEDKDLLQLSSTITAAKKAAATSPKAIHKWVVQEDKITRLQPTSDTFNPGPERWENRINAYQSFLRRRRVKDGSGKPAAPGLCAVGREDLQRTA